MKLPLSGVTVIELGGIGPGPFCGMMLGDMGARIIRVDRPGARTDEELHNARHQTMNRHRESVALDLKRPNAVDAFRKLAAIADVVIDPFRPGVVERLGIGPNDCQRVNPSLIYARMTGWGQTGPYAGYAGHDINYLAISGVLHAIGERDGVPVPPLNVVGDFGGGAMMLAFGIVSALYARGDHGPGTVIDGAVSDGSALLASMFAGRRQTGWWIDERGSNILDSGCPYYRVYRSQDGKHIAVGAMEDKFFNNLLQGLSRAGFTTHLDPSTRTERARWPRWTQWFERVFEQKSREAWIELLGSIDACVSPVLTFAEAPDNEHNAARGTFRDLQGYPEPAPAPRLPTKSREVGLPPAPGRHTARILAELGYDKGEVRELSAQQDR